MDYRSILIPKIVGNKFQYDPTKVWWGKEEEKNGFFIGGIVCHVNPKLRLITKFEVVTNEFYTNKLEGINFCEYISHIRIVSLRPIEGDWAHGSKYDADWFKSAIEFPFDLIQLPSDETEKLMDAHYSKTFEEADRIWEEYIERNNIKF